MDNMKTDEKEGYQVIENTPLRTRSRVSSDLPDWVIHEYIDDVEIINEDTYASVVKCGAANWARLEYVRDKKTAKKPRTNQ